MADQQNTSWDRRAAQDHRYEDCFRKIDSIAGDVIMLKMQQTTHHESIQDHRMQISAAREGVAALNHVAATLKEFVMEQKEFNKSISGSAKNAQAFQLKVIGALMIIIPLASFILPLAFNHLFGGGK